ncbi:MAG: SDR family oxidoreductase [Gammaproteobacteria bacterium]|nr:SDR family oxidoreductase [Gammaproteobacteria bacterium]
MSDPVCLITGATSGIGTVTAREMANAGFRVVMACRDLTRAAELRKELRNLGNAGTIDILECDLASLASVRKAADTYLADWQRLDVLINNAGIMPRGFQRSVDGFELTFATNHLGPFLLTNLVLPLIERSAPARIVNVASRAHRRGVLELEGVDGDGSRHNDMRSYSRSKLANVMFTLALARRLQSRGVTCNCLHPGVVATNIIPQGGWMGLAGNLLKPFMLSEERGAETSLYLALSDAVAGESGGYYDEHKVRREPSSTARDVGAQEHLWRKSAAWVGFQLEIPP